MWKTRMNLTNAAVLAAVCLLTACGGGSSSDELDEEVDFGISKLQIAAGAQASGLDGIANADIQLFWQQRNKYDFYRLFVNPDGRSGFTKIGGDVPTEELDPDDEGATVFLTRAVTADQALQLVTYEFDWSNALFLLKGCKGEQGNAECEIVDFQSAKDLSGGNIDTFSTPSPANQFQTTFGISVALSQDSLVAAVGANTATLFECAADEIIEVDEDADESCEKQIFPICADFPEDEQPADCVEAQSEDPVFKVVLNAGIVYMYTRDSETSAWTLAPNLEAPILGEEDNFGWSIDISDDGSVVSVTAPGEDSMSGDKPRNNSEESSGAAYVFRRDGDEWLYEDFLKAANPAANDLFGWAGELSGDGNWLAVSAVQRGACRGTVFMFHHENGVWTQQQTLTAPTRAANDVFGYSLSLDYAGKSIAVGANQFPDALLLPACAFSESKADNLPGEVHVFRRQGTAWDLSATLAASNADNGDRFGNSVSFDRNAERLLVGAPLESSNASGVNGNQGNDGLTIASGAAYLYEKSGANKWQQTQYIKASNTGPTDQFGNTVRLGSQGASMAIAAWGESGIGVGINSVQDFDRASASGAVYIFKEDATPGLWMQKAYVKPPFIAVFSSAGWSLAISDTSPALLVGAPGFLSPGGGASGNVFFY